MAGSDCTRLHRAGSQSPARCVFSRRTQLHEGRSEGKVLRIGFRTTATYQEALVSGGSEALSLQQ